jgi:rhodanese-related sulfurtransferase
MTTTATDLVARAKATTESLDPQAVARELADGALIVDLREQAEVDDTGTIAGSVHIPRGLLEFKADPAHPLHAPEMDPTRRTILYCASGGRSALAALSLRELGYQDVAHLDGGIQAWTAAGNATALP